MCPQLANTALQGCSKQMTHVLSGLSPPSRSAACPTPSGPGLRCRCSSRRLFTSWMRFLCDVVILQVSSHNSTLESWIAGSTQPHSPLCESSYPSKTAIETAQLTLLTMSPNREKMAGCLLLLHSFSRLQWWDCASMRLCSDAEPYKSTCIRIQICPCKQHSIQR